MDLWGQLGHSGDESPAGVRRTLARFHGTRFALAASLAALTLLLFPSAPASDVPLYEVGSVATDNVIAPFAFSVKKEPEQLQREREDAARSVTPVLAYVPAALDSATGQLRSLMRAVAAVAPDTLRAVSQQTTAAVQRAAQAIGVSLSPVEASYLAQARRRQPVESALERVFARWLASGVVATGSLDTLRGDVLLRRGEDERRAPADSVSTFNGFVSRARLIHPDPGSPVGDAVYVKLLGTFFHPTLVQDRVETERQLAEVRRSVSEDKHTVREGEKIVGAHEVVGRAEYEKLRGLQSAIQSRREGEHAFGRVAGAFLFNLLLIHVFGLTLYLFRPQLYGNLRALVLFAVTYLVVLTSAALIGRGGFMRAELVPVALAAVLFSVMFDSRISMIASMVLAVLIGSQAPFRGTNALFVGVVAGAAAAFSVRALRRRNQALAPILTITLAYLLSALALGLMLDWTMMEIVKSVGWGALNALVCVPLAMALLPLAEDFSGIDTYLRLLEWSDLNRPLMRRLSLEAPGTYSHTMRIADLAESASNAIGANGLLARVGAYYHDIGKLKKPQYFIENQQGKNPHEKLKPQTSAGIIRNHVEAGLELAEKENLPQAVRAFITEHHGTGSISYFLEKAKERDGVQVNPSEFTYPGPNPQSAETAVVMLADGVEASTRVIADPTPDKLRAVIDHIVRQRIDSGQLRDAPLTLRQIEIIKDQFARALIGQHHHRTDYPTASGGVTSEFASYGPRR